MRQVIKFLILFIMGQVSLPAQNDLHLNSSSGFPFQVIFNDSLINKTPTAHVMIRNITEDTVSLILKTQSLQDTAKVYLLEKRKRVNNKEFLYEVVEEKNQLRLKYASLTDRSGVELVVAKPPDLSRVQSIPNDFGNFAEIKNGHAVFYDNLPENGCEKGMSDEIFKHAKSLLAQDNLRDDKLSLIEKTIINNCLNMVQLQYFIERIPFELDRVKIVKKAYPNLVDKENYKSLQKSFKLQSAYKKTEEIFTDKPKHISAPDTCRTAVAQPKLESMLKQLRASDNDNVRLQLLKYPKSTNCYSVSQVRLILKTFVHDRERVEASRILYPTTIEKKQFGSLSDEFTYPHWIDEFKSLARNQQEN